MVGIILAFTGVFFIQGGSFVVCRTATIDSKQVTTLMFLIGSFGLLIISLISEPGRVKAMISAPISIDVTLFQQSF